MRRSRRTQMLAPLALCAAITAVTAVAMGGASLGAAGPSAVNPAFLPLGDGKVTTTGARRGYVYACRTGFIPAGGPHRGGGAQVEGPWIHGETYDLTAKATVDGSVHWPGAKLRESRSKRWLSFSGNGLPKWATTGEFPISSGDDAYTYDRNPNSIRSQSVRYSLPRQPKKASRPGCLSGGPIGIAKNGVAIFDALDAEDRDAVAHETQDHCGGHPQRLGIYHYHDDPLLPDQGRTEEPRLRPGRLGARRLPDLRPARPRRQAADERRPRRLPRPDQQGLLRRPLAAHLPLQRDARVPLHARLLPRHAAGVGGNAAQSGRRAGQWPRASGAPFAPIVIERRTGTGFGGFRSRASAADTFGSDAAGEIAAPPRVARFDRRRRGALRAGLGALADGRPCAGLGARGARPAKRRRPLPQTRRAGQAGGPNGAARGAGPSPQPRRRRPGQPRTRRQPRPGRSPLRPRRRGGRGRPAPGGRGGHQRQPAVPDGDRGGKAGRAAGAERRAAGGAGHERFCSRSPPESLLRRSRSCREGRCTASGAAT